MPGLDSGVVLKKRKGSKHERYFVGKR
jgi:hypothetical protein